MADIVLKMAWEIVASILSMVASILSKGLGGSDDGYAGEPFVLWFVLQHTNPTTRCCVLNSALFLLE